MEVVDRKTGGQYGFIVLRRYQLHFEWKQCNQRMKTDRESGIEGELERKRKKRSIWINN